MEDRAYLDKGQSLQNKPMHASLWITHSFFFNFLLSSIPLHGYNMKVKVKLLSHVRLFGTPWTVDRQSPLSMEFSR